MSTNGTMPRAERRRIENNTTGPSGLGAAEETLASVIGQTVAVQLAQMLSQLLPQMPWQPDCFFCVLAAKQVVHNHQIACANAVQAAEEQPELPPAPEVARGVTQVVVTQLVNTPAGPVPSSGSVWACWNHIELPQQAPRQSGLVGPDGSPIIARR